ncbi:MAG: DMT family transporter [Lachnospiraceae bacterium]
MTNKFTGMRSALILLLTATIWGVAFVAQSVGMDYIEPFTFNGVRSLIGALTLVPCIYFMKGNTKKLSAQDKVVSRKMLIQGGVVCGILLCIASSLQQIGLMYTTAGKAGFLTTFYIIIVPLFGLIIGKKCTTYTYIGVVLALVGLYLLSIKDGFRMEVGDLYILACAVVFALHILAIDYYAPRTDSVKMSCIQFLVSGVICMVVAFLFETPELEYILMAKVPVLYAGVMSCGVAYTLQIIGQKGMNPTVASLILSLESVIAVIAGFFLLQQALTIRELIGCAVVFVAILLAQLPDKKDKIKE